MNTVNCAQAREFLPTPPDGDEREPFLAHLRGCPGCRAAADASQRTAELLRPAGTVPDPGSMFWETQRSKILSSWRSESAPRRSRFVPLFWAAAAAAVLLSLAYGISRSRTESSPLAHQDPEFRPAPEAMVQHGPAALPPSENPTEPRSKPSPTPSVPVDPGVARRLEQMTEEAVEIGLAETPRDRVLALFGAAGERLAELRESVGKDEDLSVELAQSYLLLLREGVWGVLRDQAESGDSLADAREVAAGRARSHENELVALGQSAQGRLKEALGEALSASRELASR